MKSEHRHELKTNELAEWISNFPQWAKQNRRMIIYISVLTVVVLGVYFWKKYQENVLLVDKQRIFTGLVSELPRRKMRILQAQAQGQDLSYILIETSNNLQDVAQNTKNTQIAALALIKQAEALRTELHYRSGPVSQRDVTTQINQAKNIYTKALEKSSSNPTLIAKTKFGQGLCEEELGNFDEAKQIYHDIITNLDFEGTTAAAAAKQRLDTMADYQQKVVFKAPPVKLETKPVPAETESIQPQIQRNPNDTITPSQ